MDADRLREALAALGLSRTECEAYVAVLSRGEATAGTVAGETSVSRSDVHGLAAGLADRGLITVDESGDSTVLRARPPAEVVDALSVHLAEYEAAAEELYSRAEHSEPAFEAIHSPRSVRRRIARHVDAARQELLLVLPASTAVTLREELADAVERGVWVYCAVAKPEIEDAVSALEPGEHVHVLRSWANRPPVVVVRDVTAGVTGAHATIQGPGRGDEYAVAFDQPHAAGGLYGNAVASLWPNGRQRALADPPALPATFEQFRQGVVAAALHDLRGEELVVDVAATDTETAEGVTFEGAPVREVRQPLVEPTNTAFPIENALVLETGQGTVSVGGEAGGVSPFHEDYAATQLTLRAAERERVDEPQRGEV